MSSTVDASPAPSTAANAAAASFAALTAKLDYLNPQEIEQVRQAYRFADEAHLGQLRKSGEPYITHPIAVAGLCAEWKLDAQALMAALLHDAMEDCHIEKSELIERFGAPVAELVDGLTKLDKLKFSTREEGQAESFRKMLLAMARDVRVILIKLADRSHNLQSLGELAPEQRQRIARETLDIYAPIAHRLGLNQTYRELQELAFAHAWPWRHAVIQRAVRRSRGRRKDLIERVQRDVEQAFYEARIPMRLSGREKTLYSIYRKMDDKHLSFAQVTDLYGFRLVVEREIDCYTALGLLHQLYKPLPGKFKDHIAIPKINGYQSLHTTLIGPSGVNVEFQIRTETMHVVAESGVAAHWLYKAKQPGSDEAQRLGAKWVQSLLDIQRENRDAADFWDHVKVDLFPDAVYVFTPRGEIISLPRHATIVDFAYAIHSDVGGHAVLGRVNGQQVPLRTELRNGDVVEVQTEESAHPDPAWLSFVRTARARSKIRHYLRTKAANESQALGAQMLLRAVRAEGFDSLHETDHALWERLLRFSGNKSREELLTDIGLGKRIATIVARRMAALISETGAKPDPVLLSQARFAESAETAITSVQLDGSEGASVVYALCCTPVPGDAVIGYLGRGEALTVHRADCATLAKLRSRDSERFVDVQWSDTPTRHFNARLRVSVRNGQGVLARLAAQVAQAEADINHIDMGQEFAKDATDLVFTIGVREREHLDTVQGMLKRLPFVFSVVRI